MSTIGMTMEIDPQTVERKYVARAGEIAGQAMARKMHQAICEERGHEFEEVSPATLQEHGADVIPWDAICKWCHLARERYA